MSTIFDPENSRISLILKPTAENPRNSEGDFIRLKDGRILYAFSYYHGESADDHARCDIRCLYSDDEGETFHTGENDGEEPHLLVSAETYGEKNVMSVSLLRMENGDVGLIFILKHANTTDECLLLRSNDECETFYETTKMLPGMWDGYYVLNNCRVERLSSGRLIAPVSKHDTTYRDNNVIDGRGCVWFFASDDDGRTWKKLPGRLDMIGMTHTTTGLQEPGVIELSSGGLYAYMRTNMAFQYEALSPDGGAHWFGPQPSRFSAPESPMKIARNPYTGVYYAVWNPIPNYNGRTSAPGVWGRTPLAIAESRDGYNFDLGHMQYIEDDPARGYCYPAVFFADAKTMLLAYCSGGAEDGMCLARLTIRKIRLN